MSLATRFLRLPVLLLVAGPAALAACDGASTEASVERVPAQLEIVSGNNQSGQANTELPQPLVVRVLDAQSQPVQGQTIVWRVTSGGGTVYAGVAVTNAQGIARERWTLGSTINTQQRLEARGIDMNTGEARIFATFSATATSGPPATIVVESGNNQIGVINTWLPQPLVARVMDAYGNPVAGVTVTYSTTTPGRFDPLTAQSVTGTAGRAPVRWQASQAASPATILATAPGLGSPARFTESVRWGVADVMVLPERDTLAVNETLQLQATAYNSSGQVLTGPKFTWASSSGAAAVDSLGKVTAKAVGNAFVVGTAEGHADTTYITVTAAAASLSGAPRR